MTIAANDRQAVSYEYTTIRVERDKERLHREVHESFGWILDGRVPAGETVTLELKRDRRIRNRPVVAELQRTAEEALASIGRLERSKTAIASAVAYSVGLAGAAFFAGAVFSLNAGLIPLFLFLGFHGLLFWVAPYFLHTRLRTRKAAELAPLIDRQYGVIRETAERAHGFLK
ncbi:hypothetical protein AMES_7123 [Amycolatopsis mediterranei S699]|uniref:Uncharacterized protein n=2 Tax=Amycolatopsis mediterranei TaxID=33910 RepID=A0A0H3DH34_AMYMU|nr:hypothetical protein [Amycolatopsis mediterranei]ADJ48949.1 conserved hypothetical protein [Amycolatopsis mediterranei U32]AEK45897.1 hypothetical protein RAM_37150 [Amycolatopsis mediterranei S699]AFO80657.1 hypothetical protein AMES_7123 [Amycolatopsis mediterranei S699]AGT87785.1 hypothetical protein B737_7123 [Amycolatopsis mediterranei RB]KDU93931.1 hypothetical protein DV36_00920 [Amycolatopsis mediterranei]